MERKSHIENHILLAAFLPISLVIPPNRWYNKDS
nr:MAG TPA: hypothetical protein [Caudoviricetes sp.]